MKTRIISQQLQRLSGAKLAKTVFVRQRGDLAKCEGDAPLLLLLSLLSVAELSSGLYGPGRALGSQKSVKSFLQNPLRQSRAQDSLQAVWGDRSLQDE